MLDYAPGYRFANREIRYAEREVSAGGVAGPLYYQAICQVCKARSTVRRAQVDDAEPGPCGCVAMDRVEPLQAMMLAEPVVPPSALCDTETIESLLEKAAKKGWFMPILYEIRARELWHARFERRHDSTSSKGERLVRTRDGVFAGSALDAVAKAFEEIDNPGIYYKRLQKAAEEKWRRIRQLNGTEVTSDGKADFRPFRELLKSNYDLGLALERAFGAAAAAVQAKNEAWLDDLLSQDDDEDEI